MRIFLAFFFSLSLVTTALLPAISYLLDDDKIITIGAINEEEEKNVVKLELNSKDFLDSESAFIHFIGVNKQKIEVFLINNSICNVSIDVVLPPPEKA